MLQSVDLLFLRTAKLTPFGIVARCHGVQPVGTTMRPFQKPLAIKRSEVMTDGLGGDAKCAGQRLDFNAADGTYMSQNFVMAFVD